MTLTTEVDHNVCVVCEGKPVPASILSVTAVVSSSELPGTPACSGLLVSLPSYIPEWFPLSCQSQIVRCVWLCAGDSGRGWVPGGLWFVVLVAADLFTVAS